MTPSPRLLVALPLLSWVAAALLFVGGGFVIDASGLEQPFGSMGAGWPAVLVAVFYAAPFLLVLTVVTVAGLLAPADRSRAWAYGGAWVSAAAGLGLSLLVANYLGQEVQGYPAEYATAAVAVATAVVLLSPLVVLRLHRQGRHGAAARPPAA